VWYIDTGVDFDGGRMYIGERDFSGMASLAGFVSKASVARVYEENERLNRDLAVAKSLIVDLRAAVAGLVGASPLEGSTPSPTRKRAASDKPISLGDETDPADMDLDAL
jgi:hypothetical protein